MMGSLRVQLGTFRRGKPFSFVVANSSKDFNSLLSNGNEAMTSDLLLDELDNDTPASIIAGETAFEELKQQGKQSAEFFKEVITVLEERSELEGCYAKGLMKLSGRLMKAAGEALCALDESWRIIAEEMESVATIHKNLSANLGEELAVPLKTVYDSQQKTRRMIEMNVDKSAKKLCEKRSDQHKAKRKAHAFAKECEKVQKICADENRRTVRLLTEKQLAKLQTKRSKLEEATVKADHIYLESTISAEREREELEFTVAQASERMQQLESQRLANIQTAFGRYQRLVMDTVGPSLMQVYREKSLCSVMELDVQNDITTMSNAQSQSSSLAQRCLVLCDFYAEDFTQIIAPERRQDALARQQLLLEREADKERKGKEGMEHLSNVYQATPRYGTEEAKLLLISKLKDTSLMLNFIDFNIYKICTALQTLEKSPPFSTHRLSKYAEKYRDKSGLRQTILRLPLCACMDADENLWYSSCKPQSPAKVVDSDERNDTTLTSCCARLDEETRALSESVGRPQSPSAAAFLQLREAGDGQSPALDEEQTTSYHHGLQQEEHTTNIYEIVDEASTEAIVVAGAIYERSSQNPKCDSKPLLCRAMYVFEAQQEDELSLRNGDTIRILEKSSADWWFGELLAEHGESVANDSRKVRGLFPSNYVVEVENDTDSDQQIESSNADIELWL